MRTSATRAQERRCAVCRKPLTWPAVEFCSAACGEMWIRQARAREAEWGSPGARLGPGTRREGGGGGGRDGGGGVQRGR